MKKMKLNWVVPMTIAVVIAIFSMPLIKYLMHKQVQKVSLTIDDPHLENTQHAISNFLQQVTNGESNTLLNAKHNQWYPSLLLVQIPKMKQNVLQSHIGYLKRYIEDHPNHPWSSFWNLQVGMFNRELLLRRDETSDNVDVTVDSSSSFTRA